MLNISLVLLFIFHQKIIVALRPRREALISGPYVLLSVFFSYLYHVQGTYSLI